MTDRAKTILAFILIMMAGWSTHISGVSDETSQAITRLEIRISTQRVRAEVVEVGRPASKAAAKHEATLTRVREAKQYINRSEDFAIIAMSTGAAAFLATPVPYIFVAGGAVFLGCSMGFYWLAG
jgi:hypothetical protein